MGQRNTLPTTVLTVAEGGRYDYLLGCDPMWQIGRGIYRMVKMRPLVLNGSLCVAGFLWAMVTREVKVAPADLVQFRRAEERRRRLDVFKRAVPWRMPNILNQHR